MRGGTSKGIFRRIPNCGTVVNQVVAGGKSVPADKEIVIGHPSGMMDVKVEMRVEIGHPYIVRCTVGRTARKIMDGQVYVPKGVYNIER
jgi:2-methylaconitate cis-trans-isomerase PrpF